MDQMRSYTRNRLLYEEDALVPPGKGKAPKYQTHRRKYRKLKRLADKKGLDLDRLLLRRKSDCEWERLCQSHGKLALWSGGWLGSDFQYVVEILDTFKQRHKVGTYSYKQKRYVDTWESHRAVHVRVVGYSHIHHTDAPYDNALPLNHEQIVSPRQLGVWQLDRHETPKAKTIQALVAAKKAFCQKCIDGNRETLAAPPTFKEAHRWAENGVKMWTRTLERWEEWEAAQRKLGHVDLTDPRVRILLRAVRDNPALSQLQLWDAYLFRHAGTLNFGYVERMMPRLLRRKYIFKGKKHALWLYQRGIAFLGAVDR